MSLKLLQMEKLKKQHKQLVMRFVIKLLIKSPPSPPPPPPPKKKKKKLRENNSETVINEHDKEIPRKRFVSLKERQEIIDELRLK